MKRPALVCDTKITRISNSCLYRFGRIGVLLFFVFNTFLLRLQAQTPAIDSLKQELKNPKSEKLPILFELCWRGESMAPDSVIIFAEKAREICIRENDTKQMLYADVFTARSYYLKGRADTALQICNTGISKISDIGSMFEV